MSFRAFSIGFSAALLALACGSGDSNNGDDPIDVPEPPDGEAFCRNNPLAEDCDTSGGNQVPGVEEEEEDTPPVTEEEEDDVGVLELAAVQTILAENCGQCHGPNLTPEAARAGMNFITDLDRLAEEGKLRPLDSDNSLIIQYMRDGVMPPSGNEKVPTADINRVADYIDNPDYWDGADGPIADCTETNGQFDYDQLFEEIDGDLAGEDADDQVNFRYLTLTNRFNAGICADVSLDRDRQALVKMVNSLSTAATIEIPEQVDQDGLIYRIDLRDYEWDRAITVDGINFVDVWEAIVANNPYAVPFVGDTADDVVADTGTAVPFMTADSVNDVAVIGNLYYAIVDVDVNANLDDFVLNILGIDQAQNLLDEELVRAGTSDSRLSRQDMVAERHDIEVRAGAYWQRFDFADDQNESIFQDPFGFQEAGREAIFTLENGLFGYIIADQDGLILEDSDILLDFNQNNFRVTTSVSCHQCHNAGLIPFVDQVRDFTLDNAVGLQLNNDEVEAIEEVYPSSQEFASIVAQDTEQFYQRALESADLPVSGPDPISRVFQRFDLDMELNDVAGDLGVTPESLANDIRELDEAVQVIDQPGGSIDRDDFTQFFVNSLCILSVALDNSPDPVVCDQAQADVDALSDI